MGNTLAYWGTIDNNREDPSAVRFGATGWAGGASAGIQRRRGVALHGVAWHVFPLAEWGRPGAHCAGPFAIWWFPAADARSVPNGSDSFRTVLSLMFEPLRDGLRGVSARLDPDERRRITHTMREALVHARLGVEALGNAVTETAARLAAERTELETVRRRQGLAAQINDEETVAIAERFALLHEERVAMLESKQMVQQQEHVMAEREYASMAAELRDLMAGVTPGQAPDAPGAEERPRRTRAEKEADADDRLAALKRRMGK